MAQDDGDEQEESGEQREPGDSLVCESTATDSHRGARIPHCTRSTGAGTLARDGDEWDVDGLGSPDQDGDGRDVDGLGSPDQDGDGRDVDGLGSPDQDGDGRDVDERAPRGDQHPPGLARGDLDAAVPRRPRPARAPRERDARGAAVVALGPRTDGARHGVHVRASVARPLQHPHRLLAAAVRQRRRGGGRLDHRSGAERPRGERALGGDGG